MIRELRKVIQNYERLRWYGQSQAEDILIIVSILRVGELWCRYIYADARIDDKHYIDAQTTSGLSYAA